jgi:integrase
MKKAVLWGRITSNPVAAVTKPPQRRRQVRDALGPRQIEAIRANLDIRDATLVSVLAYAGLRPGEALALRWGDVRDRTVVVERAASLGEIKSTKTGAVRAVKILAPLANDLSRWRLAAGRPADTALVFPNAHGGVWAAEDYKNWRRRKFRTAVAAAGLPATTRPYDLRHAFCSLLLAEGRSIIEVAAQMGHAPTMTLDTYGHVIAEMEGDERVSAEDAITRTRQREQRRQICPEPDATAVTP